jgi:hypothetical protein
MLLGKPSPDYLLAQQVRVDMASSERDQEEARAIEQAWRLFLRRSGDVPFAEVVSCARARCASITPERVWAVFEVRLRRERRTRALRRS